MTGKDSKIVWSQSDPLLKDSVALRLDVRKSELDVRALTKCSHLCHLARVRATGRRAGTTSLQENESEQDGRRSTQDY